MDNQFIKMQEHLFANLPAVLIGGPPHSGKTVFAKLLKKSLKQIEPRFPFYLLRANPDGEGDWFNEIDPNVANALRQKKEFTPQFAVALRQAILHRQVPLLVDVGGKISEEQRQIASACTHAILISSTDVGLEEWRQFAQEMGLTVVAEFRSVLDGEDTLDAQNLPLQGTLCCLHRHREEPSPLFFLLARHIVDLFTEASRAILCTPEDDYQCTRTDVASLIQRFIFLHKKHAPIDRVIDVEAYTKYWKPDMLLPFLRRIPPNQPLAIYGVAPNWVYGALSAWSYPAPLVQFDAVLGWVRPPSLKCRTGSSPFLKTTSYSLKGNGVFLTVNFAPPYVPLALIDGEKVPPIDADFLVLDGKLSMWMWTALVRTYRHVQRIYVHQPQLTRDHQIIRRKAVLIYDSESIERLGQIQTFNLPWP